MCVSIEFFLLLLIFLFLSIPAEVCRSVLAIDFSMPDMRSAYNMSVIISLIFCLVSMEDSTMQVLTVKQLFSTLKFQGGTLETTY